MATVKGSKKYRIKIVEYRLRNAILVAFLLFAVFCAILVGTYFGAQTRGIAEREKALEDIANLTAALGQAESRASMYEQQLANLDTAAEVDRQANEDVRKEVIALKDEIARLEEENSFYRGLMLPNEQSSGLTLGSVELVAARGERRYAYKVVVQQLAARHDMLSGDLTFEVIGKRNGVDERLPLKDLSESVSSDKIKLRFKYFQVIEGELDLPVDFDPQGIEVRARTTGSKAQSIDKKFGWLVGER